MFRYIVPIVLALAGCTASTTVPEVTCSGPVVDSNHACGELVTAAEEHAAEIGCTLDPRARIAADGVCRSAGAQIEGCLDALSRSATCLEIDSVLRSCGTMCTESP